MALRPRVLYVFAAAGDERRRRQLEALEDDIAAARERSVAVIDVEGAAQGPDLRERHAVAEGEFAAVLLGRDGTEKARWTEPVAPAELWARIDEMPMRRAEAGED